MKNERISSAKLWLLAAIAFALAISMAFPGFIQKGNVVQAGCTMTGMAIFVDGVPTCDCTTQTPNTCSCIVRCPPKGGGDIEIILN